MREHLHTCCRNERHVFKVCIATLRKCMHNDTFLKICVYVCALKCNKETLFCVYKLDLNFYTVPPFPYFEVARWYYEATTSPIPLLHECSIGTLAKGICSSCHAVHKGIFIWRSLWLRGVRRTACRARRVVSTPKQNEESFKNGFALKFAWWHLFWTSVK